MDAKELGRRLKEARLAQKLTQSEVVGDFITRNMLSQIESGAATPSMRTLEYLAQKLGVPVSQLIESPDYSDATEDLIRAKRAFGAGEYELSLSFAGRLSIPFYDEANALLARSHLALAQQHLAAGDLFSACSHARFAAEKAQLGVYASRELRAEALLVLDEATAKITP